MVCPHAARELLQTEQGSVHRFECQDSKVIDPRLRRRQRQVKCPRRLENRCRKRTHRQAGRVSCGGDQRGRGGTIGG